MLTVGEAVSVWGQEALGTLFMPFIFAVNLTKL
jgi:hypothetical protein